MNIYIINIYIYIHIFIYDYAQFYAQVDISWSGKPYENVISNPTLEGLYRANALSLGVDLPSLTEEKAESFTGGSTDMGNVSHVVPAIHPVFNIGMS